MVVNLEKKLEKFLRFSQICSVAVSNLETAHDSASNSMKNSMNLSYLKALTIIKLIILSRLFVSEESLLAIALLVRFIKKDCKLNSSVP